MSGKARPQFPSDRRPKGLAWRSSTWFITLVVTIGIFTDICIYSLIIPVIPYRLEELGYTQVSSKTSYLLLAYSIGLIFATPVIVWFCERLNDARRTPLLVGLTFMAGSLVMFMLAPNYPVFIIARVLQGISGSVVWVVGLALLCDTVPEAKVAQQLGIAMSGVTIGFAAGPPVGGVLYQKLGFHSPFIFAICLTAIDFIGRLVIIERKDAIKWDFKPCAGVEPSVESKSAAVVPEQQNSQQAEKYGGPSTENNEPTVIAETQLRTPATRPEDAMVEPVKEKMLSSWAVLRILLKKPRAIAAVMNTLLFAMIITSQEPTLALRMTDVWGLNSFKVGLVYIAAIVPTLFSGVIVGFLADRYGAEIPTLVSLILAAPWGMVLAIRGPLALFIVSLSVSGTFLTGTVAPLTSEMAITARDHPNLTYGHVFGAWNLAYSIGSAIGPIIGGQIYDHSKQGWLVICIIDTALVLFSAVLSFMYIGQRPLAKRMSRLLGLRQRTDPHPLVS